MTCSVRSLASLAAMSLLLAEAAGAQQKEPYPGLDRYVDSALRTWDVPGLALAIVRNDSVIYARGYGVREIGKSGPVDERTIFAIGSASKAFTAAAIAMLVDEKKVSLDAPAATYLPGLQLHDPYATRELTVRDLLTHRSGLARGDLTWYGSGYDRDEIVRRVRFLRPSWSFRSQFGYQNIMYIAAGQLVAHVGNTTWDEFIRDRFLVPLGMTATSTTIRNLAAQGDVVATPHALVNDTVRAIAWRNIDNAGPAGSINSSALDMTRWVRLQLANGTLGGRPLISARMMDEMRTPQTVIRLDSANRRLNPETHLQSYGLGWFLQDYRGRLVVQHGGNIDGFSALVAMLPEEKLGLVILTNMNGTALPTAVMNRVFDLQLQSPPRDWSAILHERTKTLRARTRAAQQKTEAERVPNTRPSLPLRAYAGTYVDSLHGEVVVRENDGKLSLSFGPNWRGELSHWHFDTFRVWLDTPAPSPIAVVFRLGADAEVDDVQIDLAGPITFDRRPDPSAPTP